MFMIKSNAATAPTPTAQFGTPEISESSVSASEVLDEFDDDVELLEPLGAAVEPGDTVVGDGATA